MTVIQFPSRDKAKPNQKDTQPTETEGQFDLTTEQVWECMRELNAPQAPADLVLRIAQELQDELLSTLAHADEQWLASMTKVQAILARCKVALGSILEYDETLGHAALGSGRMWWKAGTFQELVGRLADLVGYAERSMRGEAANVGTGLKNLSDLIDELEAELTDLKDAA